MNFWNVQNPAKPKGIKDPNARLDFPISFAKWLADISDTYKSHTVRTTGSIVCDSSTESNGVITVWISGGTTNETATFTIQITTTSGRVDERTFYLSIKDR